MAKRAKQRNPSQAIDGSRDSLIEGFLDWIEQYIEDHGIEVGDPLPTEEEIVKKTQLSRTSVREGLTRLRALGLVETKRKRGMRLIRSVALLDLVRALSQTEISDELKPHVRSFRSAVELGLGPEIFRQCQSRDVSQLQRIYDQMIEKADDAQVWPELDCEFHLKLVSISGNRLAVWFHQLLDPFFRAYAPSEFPVPQQILDRHLQIIVALRGRNPFQFEHALREHHLRKLAVDYDEAH